MTNLDVPATGRGSVLSGGFTAKGITGRKAYGVVDGRLVEDPMDRLLDQIQWQIRLAFMQEKAKRDSADRTSGEQP